MGVSKAAFESVARYLARDLGPQGIRVNLVSAGPLPQHRGEEHPRLREASRRSGPSVRRSAGTSRTPSRSPRRAWRCCPTGSPPPPARWSTSTAASTPSAPDPALPGAGRHSIGRAPHARHMAVGGSGDRYRTTARASVRRGRARRGCVGHGRRRPGVGRRPGRLRHPPGRRPVWLWPRSTSSPARPTTSAAPPLEVRVRPRVLARRHPAPGHARCPPTTWQAARAGRSSTSPRAPSPVGQLGDFPVGGPGSREGNLTFSTAGNLDTYLVPGGGVDRARRSTRRATALRSASSRLTAATPRARRYVNHVPQDDHHLLRTRHLVRRCDLQRVRKSADPRTTSWSGLRVGHGHADLHVREPHPTGPATTDVGVVGPTRSFEHRLRQRRHAPRSRVHGRRIGTVAVHGRPSDRCSHQGHDLNIGGEPFEHRSPRVRHRAPVCYAYAGTAGACHPRSSSRHASPADARSRQSPAVTFVA